VLINLERVVYVWDASYTSRIGGRRSLVISKLNL
jgi:hypothetical protein